MKDYIRSSLLSLTVMLAFGAIVWTSKNTGSKSSQLRGGVPEQTQQRYVKRTDSEDHTFLPLLIAMDPPAPRPVPKIPLDHQGDKQVTDGRNERGISKSRQNIFQSKAKVVTNAKLEDVSDSTARLAKERPRSVPYDVYLYENEEDDDKQVASRISIDAIVEEISKAMVEEGILK